MDEREISERLGDVLGAIAAGRPYVATQMARALKRRLDEEIEGRRGAAATRAWMMPGMVLMEQGQDGLWRPSTEVEHG
jgi:hypothetical protein